MPKGRKRGYGTYVDEDTGEVAVVQTLKQAKRAHQKTGKWYKEPTEAELRAWDREEKIQKEQEQLRKKLLQRKVNTAKRQKQVTQTKEEQSRLCREGRLTFEQMATKRPEGQPSLHSFFKRPPLADISSRTNGVTMSQSREDREGTENKKRVEFPNSVLPRA